MKMIIKTENKNDKRAQKGEATKVKIISASIELFSKKGYDAASVNEISSKARLTKSLVYHHFKNKEEILMTIIDSYQQKMKIKLDELISEKKIEDLDGFFLTFKDSTQKFLSDNRKIVKIVLAEAFKNKVFAYHLFKTFDDYMKYFLDRTSDISKETIECIQIEDFYFHFIPMITFSVLHENWCEYYKENYDKVRQEFFSVFQKYTQTHI